jgi:uncharacterized protein YajQ (UPF0234 family)
MAQSSFDVVSEVDLQEIDNAVNQTIKEMRTRFDFKGSKSSVEFLKSDQKIEIIADNDLKLRNIHEILKNKIVSRGLSVKALTFCDAEEAFSGTLRQKVELINGLDQEKARKVVKLIKDERFKAQASIQGDIVRVTSKSRDELQAIMQLLRSQDLDIPLQFTNFR